MCFVFWVLLFQVCFGMWGSTCQSEVDRFQCVVLLSRLLYQLLSRLDIPKRSKLGSCFLEPSFWCFFKNGTENEHTKMLDLLPNINQTYEPNNRKRCVFSDLSPKIEVSTVWSLRSAEAPGRFRAIVLVGSRSGVKSPFWKILVCPGEVSDLKCLTN